MKHTIQAFFVLLILLTGSNSFAQSNLKKANKEFELYAFNLAIKSYRKVLAKDGKNVVALARMADCYRHLNQMDEAASWYSKAVQLKGVDPIHIFNYAKTLQALGQYEQAKKWFLVYGEGQPIFGDHFAENCDFAISMRGIKPLYRVKNEYVSSPSSDFGVAFFGDQVVYASTRRDIGERLVDKASADWAGSTKNQLFITGRDQNGFLQKPKFLHPDLSNNYDEGPLSYTADGKKIAFTKNNFVDGTRQIPSSGLELSIYLAEAQSNGDWSDAKPFPFNGSGYSSGYPSLSADGKMIFFSSNRPDGYGGYDIYVSYEIGETWSTPLNLGPTVNSPGNELSPFIDDNTLYFSSDWHQGLGGLDIFRAEKEEDKWVKIYHLGNTVNSPRDDYGFVHSSKHNIGYFTSNRAGGKGKEDIYQVTKMTDDMEIVVMDAASEQPLEGVTIDFSSCGESIYRTGADGKYLFQALAGMNCEVLVSKDGFDSYVLKVESAGKRQTKTYKVSLAKEADKFLGRVYNPVDNSSVDDVLIIATNQKNGQQIQTRTDANGTYSLAMQPNTNYLLRFSKAGFLDTHNRIGVGDGSDRGLLGTLAFRPVGSGNGNAGGTVAAGGKPTSSSTSTTTGGSTESTGSSTATTGSGTIGGTLESGYSVQIAAVYGDREVPVASYENLSEIGNIYSRPEKGYKKVRLGIFADKKEAESARKQITAKGYKSAFVVVESLEDMVDVEFYYSPEDKQPATKPENTTATPPTTKVEDKPVIDIAPTTANSPYKVRLASYKNPKFFDPAKVENVGTLERRKSGAYTVMLLSGFSNLEEARSARQKARQSGFKEAHVVIEDNGRLVKVNM